MNVRQAMVTKLVTVQEHDTVLEALKKIVVGKVSGAPVIHKDNSVAGLVTEYDLLLAIDFVGDEVPVSKIMRKDVKIVHPDTSLEEVKNLLVRNDFRRTLVVENNSLVGIVSRRDILRAHLNKTEKDD